MANSYIITSVQQSGTTLIVTGSVNGVSVGVCVPAPSASILASAVSFQNFIAPLMLAAVPPAPTVFGALNLTFSQ
jgi:hypothetical protein